LTLRSANNASIVTIWGEETLWAINYRLGNGAALCPITSSSSSSSHILFPSQKPMMIIKHQNSLYRSRSHLNHCLILLLVEVVAAKWLLLFQQRAISVSWRRSTPTVAAAQPLIGRKLRSSGQRCTVECGWADVYAATTVTWVARRMSGPKWMPCVRADSVAAGSPCRVSTRASLVPEIWRRTSRLRTTACPVRTSQWIRYLKTRERAS